MNDPRKSSSKAPNIWEQKRLFAHWFDELVMVDLKHGGILSIDYNAKGFPDDSWFEYFEDGYTPEQCWDEEKNHGRY